MLCFELLAKKNRTWTLHYTAGAVAETDVPETLLDLLKQRRRWLNGSFFSLIYFVAKFHNLLARSDHSLIRRIALMVQFLYQASALVLSWFGVGSLYLSLIVIYKLALDASPFDEAVKEHIIWAFALFYTFVVTFQVGVGGKRRSYLINTSSMFRQ